MGKIETDSEGRMDKLMCPGRRLALVTTAYRGVSALALTLAILACSRADAAQNEKGVAMKGFVQDIEGLTIKNDEFRRVVYTATNCQLVVMSLKPKEEIGAEVHKLDQFLSRGRRKR